MLPVAQTSSWRLGRIVLSCLGVAAACLLSALPAKGQASQEPKPVMVEDTFKDVRLLKAISVNEFMATMGFFSASLGTSCTHCHVDESGGNWARYADDTTNKQTARSMIAMVSAINKNYFGGRRVLTCYSCHRGGERPLVTPSLAELYSTPPTPEPDQLLPSGPNTKSADQILDKYIQALGGPQRLNALESFIAKGVFQGYASPQKSPVEVFLQGSEPARYDRPHFRRRQRLHLRWPRRVGCGACHGPSSHADCAIRRRPRRCAVGRGTLLAGAD